MLVQLTNIIHAKCLNSLNGSFVLQNAYHSVRFPFVSDLYFLCIVLCQFFYQIVGLLIDFYFIYLFLFYLFLLW